MARFLRESWLVIVLAVACGFAVAGVYRIEQPQIERNKRARLAKAILAVVPGGAKTEPAEIEGLKGIHRVFDEAGRQIGWAAEATGGGFQGPIELVVGLSLDATKITGIEVLESLETPGLGDKINDEPFKGQFAGKPTEVPLEVVKKQPSRPHEIHAITAATISSRSVVEIVNRRLAEVKDRLAKEAVR